MLSSRFETPWPAIQMYGWDHPIGRQENRWLSPLEKRASKVLLLRHDRTDLRLILPSQEIEKADLQISHHFGFPFVVDEMADMKPGLRKPVFTKVDQLRPGTNGHTLTVKVVDSKMVLQKKRPDGPQVRQMRIAECLVGDETGMILVTARNEQVDMMTPGTTLILRNAKIDMFKGSMRLAVDKWGRIEVTDPADFTVKEDNNLSLVEYELVNVVEE
ncbi:unnamed protein product [Musa acuminata subsp. burmannicoides]